MLPITGTVVLLFKDKNIFSLQFNFFSQHKIDPAVQLNETKMSTLHENTKTEHEKNIYCYHMFKCVSYLHQNRHSSID